MSLLPFLNRVIERENLSAGDAEQAMYAILGGESSSTQIGAFLVAMRMKGETDEEVLGFARAMRSKATPVDPGLAGEPLLDIVGTGGDALSTFNISTTCGARGGWRRRVRVAKHGNRSISSQCGAADVLESLGIKLIADPEQMGRSIREIGIGFLFAPALHPAMKYAQPARRGPQDENRLQSPRAFDKSGWRHPATGRRPLGSRRRSHGEGSGLAWRGPCSRGAWL